jgi:hypothetical protein
VAAQAVRHAASRVLPILMRPDYMTGAAVWRIEITTRPASTSLFCDSACEDLSFAAWSYSCPAVQLR